jgi:hypothetical protein
VATAVNSTAKSSVPTGLLSLEGCILHPDSNHSILDTNCGTREIKRNDERGMDCWIREGRGRGILTILCIDAAAMVVFSKGMLELRDDECSCKTESLHWGLSILM